MRSAASTNNSAGVTSGTMLTSRLEFTTGVRRAPTTQLAKCAASNRPGRRLRRNACRAPA
jgi:hypothetical protein